MNTGLKVQGRSAISTLDAWLSSDDVFAKHPELASELRLEMIREAFSRHVEQNGYYRAYAERRGFEAAGLTEATLGTVPLLPAGLFKRFARGVRTGTTSVIETTSSGTQGTVSLVPRDDLTLQRFFASVAAVTQELLEVEHAETVVRNLGPTVSEAKHLWISYVMAGVSVLHETEFFVRNGRLEVDALLSTLREDASDVPSVIVGPPPLLWDLARKLDGDPLPQNDRRFVVTIGGWKRQEGERVERSSFDSLTARAMGLRDATRVRDAFNMVELNTVILECAEHRKHCPPWLYVSARNAHTLDEIPDGVGILSYIDPTPTSFPGAVLSEDFGWVERGVSCACGIRGDVLHIERRVNRLESRGCAMKI